MGHSATILSFSIATVDVGEYRKGPISDPSYNLNLSSTKSSSGICFLPSSFNNHETNAAIHRRKKKLSDEQKPPNSPPTNREILQIKATEKVIWRILNNNASVTLGYCGDLDQILMSFTRLSCGLSAVRFSFSSFFIYLSIFFSFSLFPLLFAFSL